MTSENFEKSEFDFAEIERKPLYHEFKKPNFQGNPEPRQITLAFYSSRNNYVNVSPNANFVGKYILLGKLGNGAFGEVRLGVHILTRLQVCFFLLNFISIIITFFT